MRAATRTRIDRAVKALQDAADYAEQHEPYSDDLVRELGGHVEAIRETESEYHGLVQRGGEPRDDG